MTNNRAVVHPPANKICGRGVMTVDTTDAFLTIRVAEAHEEPRSVDGSLGPRLNAAARRPVAGLTTRL